MSADTVAVLINIKELLEQRNTMLRESVDQQMESFKSHEEHQAASLEALETPKLLEQRTTALMEVKQLFAQALELWSCDVGCDIPDRFMKLKTLLPDPLWDDEDEPEDPTERVCDEVLAERNRQIKEEKWTPDRDDRVHSRGQLAQVAACYAASTRKQGCGDILWAHSKEPVWPWAQSYDKRGKHGDRRLLVIAAALLVAEIERLDRKNAP